MVDSSQMSEERFRALVGAYGGDPARWPAKERDAGERLLRSSTAARAAADDAVRLDQILSAAPQRTVPGEFEIKLMADFERAAKRWSPRKFIASLADMVWPGAPLWQPACAFGLALALGASIAAFVPPEVWRSDDALSASFAFDTLPDTDVGQDI